MICNFDIVRTRWFSTVVHGKNAAFELSIIPPLSPSNGYQILDAVEPVRRHFFSPVLYIFLFLL